MPGACIRRPAMTSIRRSGALMAGAWFRLFPPTDWAFHLLAIGNAALGLFAVDRIARRLPAGRQAHSRAAVAPADAVLPILCARVPAANPTLLWTWPIATYCFLRAFDEHGVVRAHSPGRRRPGLLRRWPCSASYYSIFLIAGFAVAVAISPARRGYLLSLSPWISAIVGARCHGAASFSGCSPTALRRLPRRRAKDSGAAVRDVLARRRHLPRRRPRLRVVLLAGLCARGASRRETLRETLWPTSPVGRMLVMLLAVPLLLPALVAPLIGSRSRR